MWRRAIALIVVFVAFAAIASSAAVHDALLDVLRSLERVIAQHPWAGALSFVAFAAVSAMFAFVSVAVLTPAAVFAWGEPLSMLLLWIGWIAGGCATYAIGRFLAPRVVTWLTAKQTTFGIQGRIRRDTPFGLVLLFQLALPSEVPGYLLGLAGFRFPKYLLALAIAELPYAIATVHLGAGFVQRRGGVIIVTGMILVLISFGALHAWHKRLRAESPTQALC